MRQIRLLSVLICLVGVVGPCLGDTSTGTAFVVNADGYLLTCHHCIEDAAKIEVAIGGNTYLGTVIGDDKDHDVALLEIKATGLVPLALANSNKVEVGADVRALGFPLSSRLGADVKVTRGTISGITTENAQKVFQTDAAVNPGNSGGPMVNEFGEVIGVVSAKLVGNVVTAVGFVVPINYTKIMLLANSIDFNSEGSKDKLEGPELFKRLSPSIALLTVTPKSAAGASPAKPAPEAKPTPPPLPSKAEEMTKAQADALAELAKKNVAAPEGMVLVPGGEFEAASGTKASLNAFWVDVTEVTSGQFAKFVQETGYKPEGAFAAGDANLPATDVTWADAAAYAKWAGKRLPTELEWEYAARGTDRRTFPWGNELEAAKVNGAGQADGFEGLAPAGALKGASPWGALDMAGNAWEWTADWWEGPDSRLSVSRAIRGGSYASTPGAVECVARAPLMPGVSLAEVGFRCVKDEPSLTAVVKTEPGAVVQAAWDAAVKFKGEGAELKCSPLFDQITFRTALGPLVLRREVIRKLRAGEVELLGGSRIKGSVEQTSLKVRWSLGEREIPLDALAEYTPSGPAPVVSLGVTPEGKPVLFQTNATLGLRDESILVGQWKAEGIRMDAAGVGEVTLKPEQIGWLEVGDAGLSVTLMDGNTVTGKLVGEYALKLLEGDVTIRPDAPLQSLAFTRDGSRAIERMGPDGGVMVWVPAGEFMMGSENGDSDEKPVHKVRITKGFWLGKHEVTNAQYRKFCEATGKTFPSESTQGDDHPVVYVSWNDAKAYCDHYGLVLPTEAQWEYAARGRDALKYPWGDEWDAQNCCFDGNRGPGGRTFPVGSFPDGASWCGALDMAGNVWEWCADWKGDYGAEMTEDPTGPATGRYRLLRGGSWVYYSSSCRSAYRGGHTPGDSNDSGGFRCARTP